MSRYQTGPLATVIFFLVIAFWFVWGLIRALHLQEKSGWLQAGMSLLVLISFHNRFSKSPDEPRDTE